MYICNLVQTVFFMIRNIFVLLLTILPIYIYSQTQVSGKVIDDQGKPLPFANIIFVNSTKGVVSDASGKFSLYSEKNHNYIEVSSLGFTSKKIRLQHKITKNLIVELTEGEELEEVVVVGKPTKSLSKKENPAYTVLQGIWKNKSKKGLKNSQAYEYKKHSVSELGINQLDTIFLKKVLGNDYAEFEQTLMERKNRGFFSMPIYIKENVQKVYGNNQINKQRVDTEAERSQGVAQNGYGLERITKAFDEFDIYENSYLILNRPFVSPLSEYGYGTYHYVLKDTLVEENRNFYRIYFFPKIDADLALEGNFIVDTKTFIIKSIEMKTTPKTNLNMVRGLFFEKHFTIENDSIYYLEKEIQEADFTILSKDIEEKGLYIRNIIGYSDVVLNQPKATLFYEQKIVQKYRDQFVKGDTYWQQATVKSANISKTTRLIKEVADNPKVKLITTLADIIGTGYVSLNSIPLGKGLQFGTYWQVYESNDVEKHRFRLGFRTFNSIEDRFRSYFYGAYGIGDKRFKYGLSAKYLLSEEPRVTFGGAYQDDYLQLGNYLIHDDGNFTFRRGSNAIINRGENYFLTRNQKTSAAITYVPLKNIEVSVFGVYQHSQSADPEHFFIAFRDLKNNQTYTNYTDFNTGLNIKFTPGRNVFGYGVEQRYGEKIHDTYVLKYTKGASGALGSQFDYDKVQVLIKKPITVWNLGMLNTTFEAGKIFGTVPLTILTPTPANQAYSIIPQSFALLDYYDFINDTYLNGYFEHHFNGFILNKIPLVDKTKLRSLLFARFAYGTISQQNRDAHQTNLIYNTPEKLYWEYGFGIENIGFGNIRPFRLDFIWRGDFNDVNGTRNPKFGIRFSVMPNF